MASRYVRGTDVRGAGRRDRIGGLRGTETAIDRPDEGEVRIRVRDLGDADSNREKAGSGDQRRKVQKAQHHSHQPDSAKNIAKWFIAETGQRSFQCAGHFCHLPCCFVSPLFSFP